MTRDDCDIAWYNQQTWGDSPTIGGLLHPLLTFNNPFQASRLVDRDFPPVFGDETRNSQTYGELSENGLYTPPMGIMIRMIKRLILIGGCPIFIQSHILETIHYHSTVGIFAPISANKMELWWIVELGHQSSIGPWWFCDSDPFGIGMATIALQDEGHIACSGGDFDSPWCLFVGWKWLQEIPGNKAFMTFIQHMFLGAEYQGIRVDHNRKTQLTWQWPESSLCGNLRPKSSLCKTTSKVRLEEAKSPVFHVYFMIFNEYSIVCPFYHHFDGESSFFGQSRSESFRLQTSAVLRHNLGWMDIGEAQLPSPTTNEWGDGRGTIKSGMWAMPHQHHQSTMTSWLGIFGKPPIKMLMTWEWWNRLFAPEKWWDTVPLKTTLSEISESLPSWWKTGRLCKALPPAGRESLFGGPSKKADRSGKSVQISVRLAINMCKANGLS